MMVILIVELFADYNVFMLINLVKPLSLLFCWFKIKIRPLLFVCLCNHRNITHVRAQ